METIAFAIAVVGFIITMIMDTQSLLSELIF